jgi:chemotaxis protein histidine kinase CheA
MRFARVDLTQIFLSETQDYLNKIRNELSQIEENRETLLRYLHTIKANSLTHGLQALADKIHEMENLVEGKKKGDPTITFKEIQSLFYQYQMSLNN